MINECLDPDCRAHGELHRLRESKDALIRKVKRLEDRVAELYEENALLRQEIQAETEREERLFVRLPFYEALRAERDALRVAVDRVRALCDDWHWFDSPVLLRAAVVDGLRAALDRESG